MCLAIPAKVEVIENGVAQCRVGEGETFVTASLMLLDEEVTFGDYVIIHAGFAIRRMDRDDAMETIKLFQEGLGLELI